MYCCDLQLIDGKFRCRCGFVAGGKLIRRCPLDQPVPSQPQGQMRTDENGVDVPPTARRDPLACRSIGDPTGDDVEQIACGCPGAKLTTVFECDLHGLCAPLARVTTLKNEQVTACIGCNQYSSHDGKVL